MPNDTLFEIKVNLDDPGRTLGGSYYETIAPALSSAEKRLQAKELQQGMTRSLYGCSTRLDDLMTSLLDPNQSQGDGADETEDGGQTLGTLGRQLADSLPLDQRKQLASYETVTFLFTRVNDFKIARLQTVRCRRRRFRLRDRYRTREHTPFVYEGAWSPDARADLLIDLLALLVLREEMCRDLATWCRGRPENGAVDGFLFEIPPLAIYDLRIAFHASLDGDEWTLRSDKKGFDLRLPHRTCPPPSNGDGRRLVCGIPSMIRLGPEDESNDDDSGACELLLASPHVRRAVMRGSDLWADRDIRSALLIAPPGSGKEILAKFLHVGRARFAARKPEQQMITVTLLGLRPKELRRVLFGSESDRVGGALREANGVTLFIDEIDKAGNAARSSLLRFLENDEVAPEGQRPFELAGDDAKKYKCLRLFAGAENRVLMFAQEPPDFWTRIQHVVEMVHPLEIHPIDERRLCLQQYFLMFLYRHLEKADTMLDRDFRALATAMVSGRRPEDRLCERCSNKLKPDGDSAKHSPYPLMYFEEKYIEQLSEHVAGFLARVPASTLSVRNLKAIVKRLDMRIRRLRKYEFNTLNPDIYGSDLDKERHWVWAQLHDFAMETS